MRRISSVISKDKVKLYFGRGGFSDNAKYFFLHSVENDKTFRHVWCSYDKEVVCTLRGNGFDAFDLGDSYNETIRLLLKAQFAFFTLNPAESLRSRFFLSAISGATKIQLWHGIGIKRMEMQNLKFKDFLDVDSVAKMRWASEIDYIVSPSRIFDKHWQETFGVKKFIRAGYPRNAVLLREPTDFEKINSLDLPNARGSRMRVIFSPTWGSVGSSHWSSNIDMLAQVSAGFLLDIYIKPHPYEKLGNSSEVVCLRDGVYLIPGEVDVYPVLSKFDCMITDHSSMSFDWLLLNRPLIFVAPNDPRFYMVDMLEPTLAPMINDLRDLLNFDDLLNISLGLFDNRKEAALNYFETDQVISSSLINNFVRKI